ncbi:MAG: TolC family protein [Acidobacteriota bacterium]
MRMKNFSSVKFYRLWLKLCGWLRRRVLRIFNPRSGCENKAQGEAISGTLGNGSDYDPKPVKRATDLQPSVACFTGLQSSCRLYPGLIALGFILSPASQAEARIRVCAGISDPRSLLARFLFREIRTENNGKNSPSRAYKKSIAMTMILLSFSSVAFPQSMDEKVGLVMVEKPRQQNDSPMQSSYARYIDPVDGRTSDDMVRYALANNGDLQAARIAITQARSLVRQAGLRANPMIEAARTDALNTPDNSVMIGAELPLELGGRRRARVAVAERELEMREAEVADFERRLVAETRMKYAEAIAAARNLKFTEDMLALTRDSFRLVSVKVERGKSAPLEQNLLSVELNRVDAMRLAFESRMEIAMLELKKTAGMPADENLRLRGEFLLDHQPLSREEAIRQAIEKRPDIAALRAAERLAAAQAEQARVEGKVDASLFASYERMRFGFDVRGLNEQGALVPVDGIFHNVTFGVKLMLPLRNKNQGNIEAALAQKEAARRRREFAELVARNEVTAAYARYERAREAMAVYRDRVRDQALRNLEVVRRTYELGQKTALDYISEQRRFVEIETVYTESLKEYFDALVDVERATGLAAGSGQRAVSGQ